jgi:hypothetical protein
LSTHSLLVLQLRHVARFAGLLLGALTLCLQLSHAYWNLHWTIEAVLCHGQTSMMRRSCSVRLATVYKSSFYRLGQPSFHPHWALVPEVRVLGPAMELQRCVPQVIYDYFLASLAFLHPFLHLRSPPYTPGTCHRLGLW